MGLSLKKLGDSIYHGLNPFDGGQGWTSAPPQAPAPQQPSYSPSNISVGVARPQGQVSVGPAPLAGPLPSFSMNVAPPAIQPKINVPTFQQGRISLPEAQQQYTDITNALRAGKISNDAYGNAVNQLEDALGGAHQFSAQDITPSGKSIIGQQAKGLATGLVQAPAYFAKTDIINPARQTAAQLTGNKVAFKNAQQSINNTIGKTPLQAGLRLAGNTAQLALMAAGAPIESGAEKLVAGAAGAADPALATKLATQIAMGYGGEAGVANSLNAATKLIAPTLTGAALGGPFNVAGLAATNPDASLKDYLKTYGQGTAVGTALAGGGALLNDAIRTAHPITNEVGAVGRDVTGMGGKDTSNLASYVLKNEDIVRSVMNGGIFKMKLENGKVVAFGDKPTLGRLSSALGDDVTDVIPVTIGRGKSGSASTGQPRMILEDQNALIQLKKALGETNTPTPTYSERIKAKFDETPASAPQVGKNVNGVGGVDALKQEALKYKSADDFAANTNVHPTTAKVFIKSKFRDGGGYADVPIIRKEDNITLYQGGTGENRQFWTPNEKYAKQFGNGKVQKKTGAFYQIDNGNRMTDVYVEAKPQLTDLYNQAHAEAPQVGKNVKDIPVNDFNPQTPTAELAPKPTVKLKEPTVMDKVIANSTGVTPEEAMASRLKSETKVKSTPLYTKAALAQPTADEIAMGEALGMSEKDVTAAKKEMVAPEVRPRVAEAEAAALQHLQNGGLRDEAVKIYQDTAGVSEKAAKFEVQRAARDAKQSLNVSPVTPNPLLDQYHLPTPTNAEGVARNRLAVVNSIDRAEQAAIAPFENKLHPEDRANLVDYIQGVRDVSQAHDPKLVQQAVDAWDKAKDVPHALGQNFGDTKHIDRFFPGYWERGDPNVIAMDKLKAAQAAEELAGPDVWRKLSNDERQMLIGAQERPNITSDANYGGFHNKGKIFKTQAEGIAADQKPMFDNPYDAMRRYFTGAKLQLGDQAVIQGARSVEPTLQGRTRTLDLTAGGRATVSPKLLKELKSWGVQPPRDFVSYSDIGNKIKAGDISAVGDLAKKGWQGLNTSIIKTIVANPIFHGGNQEFNAAFRVAWDMPGNKVGNMVKLVTNQIAKSAEDRSAVADEYYAHGGISPTYGKDNYGVIAKSLKGVFGENGAKLAEASPTAMAAIEKNIRLSLYELGRDRGMTPQEAITAIDRSLGGPKVLGDMSHSIGLFLHYFTTNVKSLAYTGAEVTRGNVAPAIGLAIGYGAYVAANKEWQNVTGNPNASLRAPGVIGTATQLAKAPVQIKRGQVPSVVTSHTNPAISYAVGLASNRDLRKPVYGESAKTNKIFGAGGEGIGAFSRNTLFGPGQTAGNIASGKTSIGEGILNAGLGAYTPHAKDNPAAPNIPLLNTPGAKPAQGNDPTGYQQQQAYFKSVTPMYKGLSADDGKKLDGILASETDPNGAKIGSNDKESMAKNADLYAHPDFLKRITQQKQDYAQATGQALDPLYDNKQLTPDQRLLYIKMQGERYKSDEYVHDYNANKSWLRPFETARSAYFNSLDQSTLPPSQRVQPPSFPDATNALLDQADKLTGSDKGKFIADNPALQDAYNQFAQYTANRIAAQGGAPRDIYPTATPQEQAIIKTYNAIPLGGGSKGGNKYRALWIAANPKAYAIMTNFYTRASLYGLEGVASQAQFKDTGFTSKGLGDIYNLGKYDIAKGQDSSGAPIYALTTGQSGGGPAYVDQNGNTFANLGSGSSSGGSGGSSYSSRSRVASKAANPYLYAARTGNDSAKHKKITGKKGSKVALKSKGGRPSVSLRKSLV